MAELPAPVRRDLDRAAAGIGRTATTAHPDCICGKVVGETRYGYPKYGDRRDCPQHKPLPRDTS